MKWTAQDTTYAVAFGVATAFMIGLYGYLGYCSLQMGGWI